MSDKHVSDDEFIRQYMFVSSEGGTIKDVSDRVERTPSNCSQRRDSINAKLEKAGMDLRLPKLANGRGVRKNPDDLAALIAKYTPEPVAETESVDETPDAVVAETAAE